MSWFHCIELPESYKPTLQFSTIWDTLTSLLPLFDFRNLTSFSQYFLLLSFILAAKGADNSLKNGDKSRVITGVKLVSWTQIHPLIHASLVLWMLGVRTGNCLLTTYQNTVLILSPRKGHGWLQKSNGQKTKQTVSNLMNSFCDNMLGDFQLTNKRITENAANNFQEHEVCLQIASVVS